MKTISIWLCSTEVPCWNFTVEHKKKIEDSLNNTKVIVCHDKQTFLDSLTKADTVIVWFFKQEWLEYAPNLRLIITPDAGREFIQLNLPDNISIEHSAFHGKLIGETVLGMLLSHSRGILLAHKLRSTSQWPRKELDGQMRLLRGSRITILGFGNLGTWIGRLAKPLGTKIYGIKQRISTSPDYFTDSDRILSISDLDSVLPKTDFLVLCLPKSKTTNKIIDNRRLKLMPPHSSIYNVGRGNSIDENALIDSLYSGEIAAAYLDVFQHEPLPINSPLRTCPNCFIMPHASGFGPDFMDFFVDEFLLRHGKG